MNTLTKTVAAAAVCAGFSFPALADTTDDHWDQFSCYAYVHDQCYANGENNCSEDDYNWGLDECDGYYESTGATPLAIPQNLANRRNNMTFRSSFSKTFDGGSTPTLQLQSPTKKNSR